MTRRDALKLAIAGALSPLLSLLPEGEAKPRLSVVPEKSSQMIRASLVHPAMPGRNLYCTPDADFVFQIPRDAVTARFCAVQGVGAHVTVTDKHGNTRRIEGRAAPRTEGGPQ